MRTEEEIKDFLKFLKVFEESSQEIKIMMGFRFGVPFHCVISEKQ